MAKFVVLVALAVLLAGCTGDARCPKGGTWSEGGANNPNGICTIRDDKGKVVDIYAATPPIIKQIKTSATNTRVSIENTVSSTVQTAAEAKAKQEKLMKEADHNLAKGLPCLATGNIAGCGQQ